MVFLSCVRKHYCVTLLDLLRIDPLRTGIGGGQKEKVKHRCSFGCSFVTSKCVIEQHDGWTTKEEGGREN